MLWTFQSTGIQVHPTNQICIVERSGQATPHMSRAPREVFIYSKPRISSLELLIGTLGEVILPGEGASKP